ncbi:MAG TPA: Na+/H+ antiporter subunit E [Acidimicrobiales bacterium]|nr:Na+/H+ antiporter subunit E [Acidimicrobiales bacterium]
MIGRLALGAWLAVVWVALWSDLSVANVLSGVLIAVVVFTVFPLRRLPHEGAFRPLKVIGFGIRFVLAVIRASFEVAWEVVTPRNRDSEGIVEMPLAPGCSDTVLAFLADAIGLTPGTVVVDVADDRRAFWVHVLHLDDPDRVRADLLRLQAGLVEAFGSDEAVRWCRAALAEGVR